MRFDFSGINFDQGIDISIPIQPQGVNAFWAPAVSIEPYVNGSFIGDIQKGSSVNYRNVFFNPHGNGTHTECIGHIHPEWQKVNEISVPFLMTSLLVTAKPIQKNEDWVIGMDSISLPLLSNIDSIIIRTLPNSGTKLTAQYSGKNPPYVDKELMQYLVNLGFQHFLIDLPSVDKEEDGGELAAHKIWWDWKNGSRFHCTITELVFVPDSIPDGSYALHLGMTNLSNDAVPSRPILFQVKDLS